MMKERTREQSVVKRWSAVNTMGWRQFVESEVSWTHWQGVNNGSSVQSESYSSRNGCIDRVRTILRPQIWQNRASRSSLSPYGHVGIRQYAHSSSVLQPARVPISFISQPITAPWYESIWNIQLSVSLRRKTWLLCSWSIWPDTIKCHRMTTVSTCRSQTEGLFIKSTRIKWRESCMPILDISAMCGGVTDWLHISDCVNICCSHCAIRACHFGISSWFTNLRGNEKCWRRLSYNITSSSRRNVSVTMFVVHVVLIRWMIVWAW